MGVTHFIYLSTQLASASQLERTNFELHSSPSPPQLLCLVVKRESSVYLSAFSVVLPPALQRGTGIQRAEARLNLKSKQETTSTAMRAIHR